MRTRLVGLGLVMEIGLGLETGLDLEIIVPTLEGVVDMLVGTGLVPPSEHAHPREPTPACPLFDFGRLVGRSYFIVALCRDMHCRAIVDLTNGIQQRLRCRGPGFHRRSGLLQLDMMSPCLPYA